MMVESRLLNDNAFQTSWVFEILLNPPDPSLPAVGRMSQQGKSEQHRFFQTSPQQCCIWLCNVSTDALRRTMYTY